MQIREGIKEKKPICVSILNYTRNGKPFWNILAIQVHGAPSRLGRRLDSSQDRLPKKEAFMEPLNRPRVCTAAHVRWGPAYELHRKHHQPAAPEGLAVPLAGSLR